MHKSSTAATLPPRPPLEEFFCDYVDVIGGACDEVEPQVYDVLLPSGESAAELDAAGREILRIAFDPEALPEHPGAQLASRGTPLVDALLGAAVRRGRCAQLYLNGLNLAPHDLAGRVRRALTLAEDLELKLGRARPLQFAQAVFWFEATFLSDQKEQEILPVAMDLHTAREVRHLEKLLDSGRLAEGPSVPLADARRMSAAAAYASARQQVVRSVASLANTRRRELTQRLNRQIDRMGRYYHDLRNELHEQVRRARDRGQDLAKYSTRRETLDREERLRVTELRHKSALRVKLRLVNLLVIRQPKLLLRSTAVPARRPNAATELGLVYDPLVESLEAVACPRCGCPTFALQLDFRSRVACADCAVAGRAAK